MPGDLEDFLRRAAQRRQAKTQQQQQPAQKQRPQYSDRRTERVVQAVEVDTEEPHVADIVDQEVGALADEHKRAREARKAAAKAKRKSSRGGQTKTGLAIGLSGNSPQDLARLLADPAGLKQAILLREILDRPEHRW